MLYMSRCRERGGPRLEGGMTWTFTTPQPAFAVPCSTTRTAPCAASAAPAPATSAAATGRGAGTATLTPAGTAISRDPVRLGRPAARRVRRAAVPVRPTAGLAGRDLCAVRVLPSVVLAGTAHR